MDFSTLKGKPEKDLVARLNELSQENFKARFTTEAMTPARGAQMLKRRRELARIKTLLEGRKRLESAQADEKKLENAVKDIGKPHEGTAEKKNARRKLANRLEQVKRTVRELGALKS